MTKPTREFSANEGDYSIGLAGPDAIENDIDSLVRMFDPMINHPGGQKGGIGTENIQPNAITDDLIGERTINESGATANSKTGKLSYFLNLFGKLLNAIKGTTNFYDAPADTIANIHTRVSKNTTDIGSLTTTKADKSYVDIELGKKADKTSVSSSVANLQAQITSNDSDISNLQSADVLINNKIANHMNSGNHDSIYYRKEEISKYIEGGESVPVEESFVIINADNGNGTFTYSDGFKQFTGTITPEGYLVFTLQKGSYTMNNASIVVWVDDYLRRTKTSGGIIEISTTSFALVEPEINGTEITVEYFKRIGLLGEHNIMLDSQRPPDIENAVWFEVIGVIE